MDNITLSNVLIVIVILLVILLALLLVGPRLIIGGSGICSIENQGTQLDSVPEDAAIIVDGMNFIWHLAAHSKLENVNERNFIQLVDVASGIFVNTFPTQEIHMTLKNLNMHIADTSWHTSLTELSKKYRIIYHFAIDYKLVQNAPHHMQGRDDLLVMIHYNMLESKKPVYAVSLDDYVDDVLFTQIPTFAEHIYAAGNHTGLQIDPKNIAPALRRSIHSSDNLLKYEIVSSEPMNGSIKLHKNRTTKCLNLFRV